MCNCKLAAYYHPENLIEYGANVGSTDEILYTYREGGTFGDGELEELDHCSTEMNIFNYHFHDVLAVSIFVMSITTQDYCLLVMLYVARNHQQQKLPIIHLIVDITRRLCDSR